MVHKYSKLARDFWYRDTDWPNLIKYPEFCTGKTTAEQLGLISKVLSQPETPINILEYSNIDWKRYSACGGYGLTLKSLIDKLGLRYIKLDRGVISYHPYGYVSEGWVEVEKPIE